MEDLKKNEDFDPYFNLKIVLVDEGGQLKIGYFNSCRRPSWTKRVVFAALKNAGRFPVVAEASRFRSRHAAQC